jgi:hypothetical protein
VSADYSTFAIGPESQGYKLTVDGYSGDAGDAMVVHNGAPFSTTEAGPKRDCARAYKGGWWYVRCHHSNLNGVYHGGDHSSGADGVNWYQWKGYKHSVDSTMMLRHVPPTPSPTGAPTTSAPTALPTRSPTANPTYSPTFQPTSKPTNAPSPPTAYPTPAQYHLGERGSNACDYGDAPSDAQSCREVAVAALPLDRNPTEDDFKALPNWSIIPPRGSQRLHEISEGHAPPGCSVRILPGGTIDKEVQQWDAVWNREDFAVNDGNYAVVCSGLDSTKKKPF